jgi:hypothetical protein
MYNSNPAYQIAPCFYEDVVRKPVLNSYDLVSFSVTLLKCYDFTLQSFYSVHGRTAHAIPVCGLFSV